ncbi:MAG: hypothetical protein QM783_19375 [Phycisphaerales bacterium]
MTLDFQVSKPRVPHALALAAIDNGRDADGLADGAGEVGLVGADAAVLLDVLEIEPLGVDLLLFAALEVVVVVVDLAVARADLALAAVLVHGPGELVELRTRVDHEDQQFSGHGARRENHLVLEARVIHERVDGGDALAGVLVDLLDDRLVVDDADGGSKARHLFKLLGGELARERRQHGEHRAGVLTLARHLVDQRIAQTRRSANSFTIAAC